VFGQCFSYFGSSSSPGLHPTAYPSSTTTCRESRFDNAVAIWRFWPDRTGVMQDLGYELLRIPLPRT
jgi:hypothetical protein